MFGIKIIKKSKVKDMEYEISMHALQMQTLKYKIDTLLLRIDFLSKSNTAQTGLIESLKNEIELLTPIRDAHGRYAKKKKIYGR